MTQINPSPPDTRRVGFFRRSYQNSLRPLIFIICLLGAAWCLAWAISEFQQLSDNKSVGFKKLANDALYLGVLYVFATVFEIIGIFAAVFKRPALIFMYTFLSVVAAALVIIAGFMRVVTHFLFKNDFLKVCKTLATGSTTTFRWGLWGPGISDTLSPSDAATWCSRSYNRNSWLEIVALVIELLLAPLFVAAAVSYRRHWQCSNPLSRTPQNQVHAVPPTHYAASPAPTSLPLAPLKSKDEENSTPLYAPPPQFGNPPENKSDGKSGLDDGQSKHSPFLDSNS